MKVKIDKTKCAGHNRCYSGYPEIFGVDSDGETLVLNDGEVPESLKEDLAYAISDCPENAIVIIEE